MEAMLAGSRVFKDDDLQARALDFCPAMGKREKKDKKDEKNEKDDMEGSATEKDEKEDKKDKKGRKDQKDKKDMKVKKDGKDKKDQPVRCRLLQNSTILRRQRRSDGAFGQQAEKNKGAEPSAGGPTHSSNSSEGSSSSSSDPSDP